MKTKGIEQVENQQVTKKLKALSTLNFIYYTYNFTNLYDDLVYVFGKHMADHFWAKVQRRKEDQVITVQNVIYLIMDMDRDKQVLFLQYIDQEINHIEH